MKLRVALDGDVFSCVLGDAAQSELDLAMALQRAHDEQIVTGGTTSQAKGSVQPAQAVVSAADELPRGSRDPATQPPLARPSTGDKATWVQFNQSCGSCVV